MGKEPLVNEAIFSEILGKTVSITIRDKATNEVWHNFDGIDFLKVERQKSTGMKNAPEKRVNEDGKAFTPPMIALDFSGGNTLVFVVGDFNLVARYKGVSFIFDTYTVDIIEWSNV